MSPNDPSDVSEHDQLSFLKGRMSTLTETPMIAKLETWHKVVGVLLACFTVFISLVGSYYTTTTTTKLRLDEQDRNNTAIEKNNATLENRIVTLETFGHPDHERRLTRLETRADNTDKNMQELTRKVDIIGVTTENTQKQTDRIEKMLADYLAKKP